MIWFLLLFLAGLLLSAFFSGSETGFYRVGRIRLALDARQGDNVAKALLWLTNNPSLFVATALVGNNFANYLTSLAVILITQQLFGESPAELVAPIAAAPLVFVYGELLPKHMFYMAPNRLMRRTGPVFLLFAILFIPVSLVLSLLGMLLQLLAGESLVQVRQRLARNDLKRVLDEGHHAGILGSVQRRLAQSVFDVANDRVSAVCSPMARIVSVSDTDSATDLIRKARRHGMSQVVVCRGRSRHLLGYVLIAEVLLSDGDWRTVTRPLMAIRHDESHLAALVEMQNRGESLGEVVDANGRTVGVLSLDQLLEPLFQQGS